jgi:hypothetical protein
LLVTQLRAPPPVTPSSASPPSATAGTSAFIKILGTSVGGSAYYEPGADFPNHLSVTVNGGGVTVNSIGLSVPPTGMVVTLSIASNAAPGARTVTITNPDGQSVTSAGGIFTVLCPTITVSPTGLPNATVGTPYSQTFTASGGSSPYTFALVPGGTLPPGVAPLTTGGVLSGTPTTAGSFNFSVRATDAVGCSGTTAYTLTVDRIPTMMTLVSSANPSFENSALSFTATVSAVPDVGTITWFDGTVQISPSFGFDASGKATFTTGALQAGSHTIRATYSGSSKYNASNATLTQTVNIVVPTALAVTPSNPTIAVGDTQTFIGTATYSPGFARVWSGADIWTSLAPLSPATRYPGVARPASMIGSFIYVIGGDTGAGPVASVQAYDTMTGTWTSKAPMTLARRSMATPTINLRIYAIGGYNAGPLKANASYDPTTNSWTPKADMPTAREGRAAVINGLIYVVGGRNSPTTCSNAVEAFNNATNTWTAGLTPLPTPRCDLSVVALNGLIYAIGGTDGTGSTEYDIVEVYDPAFDTWSNAAKISLARHQMAADVLDHKIYIAGGSTGTALTDRTESYDPATNMWTTHAPMPTPRAGTDMRFAMGALYMPGGFTSAGPSGLNESLKPQLLAWSSSDPHVAPILSNGVATALTTGTTTITATGSGVSGSTTLTVTAGPTTTVVESNPSPTVYGQVATFTATVTNGGNPVSEGSVTFAEGATTLSDNETLDASGHASFSTSSLGGGVHTITATFTVTANYQTSVAAVNHTVNPATLTVTANDATRTYGDGNPTLTASYSEFVNGETLGTSDITGSPSLATTATLASPVGSYPITAAVGTMTASNYTFAFVDGTLIVTKATRRSA